MVPADTPGLIVAERIDVISPHPLARLEFKDCRLPHDALLGVAGEGFKLAMRTLDIFRASVAAAALGFARRALDESVAHARSRRMFGATLADLQLTQAKLGDMAVEIDAAALLTYRAAWLRDVGQARTTKEAAMAKLVGHRIRATCHRRRGSAAWRTRRHPWPHRRTALSRHPRAAHLRGRDGSAETHHRPGTVEGDLDMSYTAHVDTFARDHLPPRDQWPDLVFDLPELNYPDRLNCAEELLDRAVDARVGRAHGDPGAGRAVAGPMRN